MRKEKSTQKLFTIWRLRCIQHELDHLEGKLCIDYGKTTDSGGEEDLLKAMVESEF